ncbi:hypothetical protein MAE_53120 [Microcystis aeruginosa NIES-843]|uniref:Uncharacterized protein n=1 Tax=Microcystis aeruginosa (strain NIES-843 / IAM M-2473) TaxID=449447 RepID=B0JY96_MICAN|nr:hypothetical protein MAE_53120 [Microcystis aeruginosa NIES-843]
MLLGSGVRSQYSGVSIQESVFRSQYSGVSIQESDVSFQFTDYCLLITEKSFSPHPTPHTPHPTPHTPHPTPHTPHPTPLSLLYNNYSQPEIPWVIKYLSKINYTSKPLLRETSADVSKQRTENSNPIPNSCLPSPVFCLLSRLGN